MYTLTELGEGCFSPSFTFCATETCEAPPSLGGDTLHRKSVVHGNLRYPPQSYPRQRNKALIAGLIKGNQWLIVPYLAWGGVPLDSLD